MIWDAFAFVNVHFLGIASKGEALKAEKDRSLLKPDT